MLDKISNLFRKKEGSKEFVDGLGNFSLTYPQDWKYDPEIAYYDGKYSICFEGKGGTKFCVSIENSRNIDFEKMAIKRLGEPESGPIGEIKKAKFNDFNCVQKTFHYQQGKMQIMGKIILLMKNNKSIEIAEYYQEGNEEQMKMIEKVEKSIKI